MDQDRFEMAENGKSCSIKQGCDLICVLLFLLVFSLFAVNGKALARKLWLCYTWLDKEINISTLSLSPLEIVRLNTILA